MTVCCLQQLQEPPQGLCTGLTDVSWHCKCMAASVAVLHFASTGVYGCSNDHYRDGDITRTVVTVTSCRTPALLIVDSCGNICVYASLPCAGVPRPLWSHSYLGYGFDVVEHRVVQLVKQQAPAAAASSSSAAAAAAGPAGSMQTGQPSKQQQQQAQQVQGHLVGPPASEGPHMMDPCLPAG